MRKVNTRRFYINVPVLDCGVYVSVGLSEDKAIEWWRKQIGFKALENLSPDSHTAAARCHQLQGYKTAMLWFPTAKPKLNTIVHESVHAVTHFFNLARVPISFENDEILAYTLGFVVERVCAGLK